MSGPGSEQRPLKPEFRRYIFLDPDGGQSTGDWTYVIVHAPTGVFYEHQYGGTANLLARCEGFLVPLVGGEGLAELLTLFRRDLRGSGIGAQPWPDDLLRRLREAVGKIPYWESAETAEGLDFISPHPLELDETRLKEADEAWVPVLTVDGPAMLIWPNSD
ncbi:DUF6210 family protein [Actinomadura adrarensis]|uniref:DUF6210 family protein n=1 Tax=Actinomadura adrarensis TaxID=1819600 RepID=A0ABW3CLK9_9ACTN